MSVLQKSTVILVKCQLGIELILLPVATTNINMSFDIRAAGITVYFCNLELSFLDTFH